VLEALIAGGRPDELERGGLSVEPKCLASPLATMLYVHWAAGRPGRARAPKYCRSWASGGARRAAIAAGSRGRVLRTAPPPRRLAARRSAPLSKGVGTTKSLMACNINSGQNEDLLGLHCDRPSSVTEGHCSQPAMAATLVAIGLRGAGARGALHTPGREPQRAAVRAHGGPP
jgi:hypothetical protein